MIAHEAYGAPPSLLAALQASEPVWPDASARLWSALAVRGFGPGAALQGPPRDVEGGQVAEVVVEGGVRGRLLAATSTLAPALGLEVVVGLAPDGRVVLVEILAAGPFAGDLASVRARLADFVGVPAEQLAVRAASRAVPGDPSGPAWQALRNVLQRVPELLRVP